MCNCGKKRNAFTSQPVPAIKQNNFVPQPAMQTMQPSKTVMFQYTGNTALSVIGGATKKSYRFNFPGDIQHIAINDAAAIAAIPVLKRI